MSFTHNSDPYGPFKCQYICNAADNCNAYFAWYGTIRATVKPTLAERSLI